MSKMQLWKQRFFYGATDMAGNLIWQIVGLYLLFYYTTVMGFRLPLLVPCSLSCGSMMPLMVWSMDS